MNAWLSALRSSALLASEVTWLEDSDRAREGVLAKGEEPPPRHPDFNDWKVVGCGCLVEHTVREDPHRAWFWIHRARPETLWVSIHEKCPPTLFVRVGTTSVEVLNAIHRLAPRRGRSEQSVSYRCFIGLAPSLAFIENRFIVDPNMSENIRLGTLPTEQVPEPEAQLVLLDSAFVTRFSSSEITILALADVYPGARLLTALIDYDSAYEAETVRAYNQATGTTYPEDLPVDVVCALHNMPVLSVDAVEREVQSGPQPMLHLFALALMHYVDDRPKAEALLRRYEGRSHAMNDAAVGARTMLGLN